MFNGGDSNSVVEDCTFSSNSANWGGGMWNYGSSPTLTKCTFSTNNGSIGGGMYNEAGSNPTVTNCTFSNNTSSVDGGGMYNLESAFSVTTRPTGAAGCTIPTAAQR
jgi:predicted outer membrane repeat protein